MPDAFLLHLLYLGGTVGVLLYIDKQFMLSFQNVKCQLCSVSSEYKITLLQESCSVLFRRRVELHKLHPEELHKLHPEA